MQTTVLERSVGNESHDDLHINRMWVWEREGKCAWEKEREREIEI